MAYTPVPTVTTGDLWTAANHNMYIRDNFAAGVPDLYTTKGDLAAATGADAAARLAVGANSTRLVADSAESTGLKWSINPMAKYKRQTTATLATGDWRLIDYATVIYDSDSLVTTGAAWKFTVGATTKGYYLVTATVMFDDSDIWDDGKYGALGLFKNGVLVSVLDYREMPNAATSAYGFFVGGSTMISLSAADYIDIRFYNGSGGNQSIVADGDYNQISISKMRD
jgi:hypothetical protein